MTKKRAKKSEIFIKYSAALDDKIKTEKWFKLLERRIRRQDQEQVKNEKRLFDICDKSVYFKESQGTRVIIVLTSTLSLATNESVLV